MNNEAETSAKIASYLDSGTAELKAGTAYRLQLARDQALARLADPQRAPAFALAGAGGSTLGGRRHVLTDVRVWIGILLIVGGVLYYQYWQASQQVREITDTDAAILTSDLPIEAYVDRGFQNWLKRSEP
jgi:Protein of unknown function (DUF3619)